MSVPSFFGSIFGELIPGGDCSSIEQDPHADPFDKEVCQQFHRFNNAFGSFNIEQGSPEDDNTERASDPQSLRDAILNRKDDHEEQQTPHRWPSLRHRSPRVDEDLDERIRRDPQLLDEYLKEEEGPQNPSKSHFHSSFSSVVITTRPDGTREERRTVRDSDGNEEVTITYSDGGQTHTEHKTDQRSIWDRLGFF